jgi:hypothetical protein
LIVVVTLLAIFDGEKVERVFEADTLRVEIVAVCEEILGEERVVEVVRLVLEGLVVVLIVELDLLVEAERLVDVGRSVDAGLPVVLELSLCVEVGFLVDEDFLVVLSFDDDDDDINRRALELFFVEVGRVVGLINEVVLVATRVFVDEAV